MNDLSRASHINQTSGIVVKRGTEQDPLSNQSRSPRLNFDDLASPIPNLKSKGKNTQHTNDITTNSMYMTQTSFIHPNESLGDHTQRKLLPTTRNLNDDMRLMSPIPFSPKYRHPQNKQGKQHQKLAYKNPKLASWDLFKKISTIFAILLVGSMIWNIFIAYKIAHLQDKLREKIKARKSLENILPSIQGNSLTNINKVNNLESNTISAIQTDLSDNTIKTNTLDNLMDQQPKYYFGNTPTTNWKTYTGAAGVIYQTVDISQYNFQNPPKVLTSLSGISSHWTCLGMTHVTSLTKDSFIIYLKQVDSTSLTVGFATNYNWQVQYLLVSNDP